MCYGYKYSLDCETILYQYAVYKWLQEFSEITAAESRVMGVRMAVIIIRKGSKLTPPHLRHLQALRKIQGWYIHDRSMYNMDFGGCIYTWNQVIIAI